MLAEALVSADQREPAVAKDRRLAVLGGTGPGDPDPHEAGARSIACGVERLDEPQVAVAPSAADEEEHAVGCAHDPVEEARDGEGADRGPTAPVVVESHDPAVDGAREQHTIVAIGAGAERREGKIGAARPRSRVDVEDVDAAARLSVLVESANREHAAAARCDGERAAMEGLRDGLPGGVRRGQIEDAGGVRPRLLLPCKRPAAGDDEVAAEDRRIVRRSRRRQIGQGLPDRREAVAPRGLPHRPEILRRPGFVPRREAADAHERLPVGDDREPLEAGPRLGGPLGARRELAPAHRRGHVRARMDVTLPHVPADDEELVTDDLRSEAGDRLRQQHGIRDRERARLGALSPRGLGAR